MHEPDWTLLRTFLAVGETGSLSAAARRLGLSQPTVGRHVSDLEAALGVNLFRRGRTGYDLTEKGAALYDRAAPMRDQAAAVARLAAGSSETVSGTVRVAASEIMAAYVLPGIAARLARAEPAIQIEIVASNRIENLLRRDADIAVRMIRPDQLDLVARHVADLPLRIGAATAYLDRRGRPQSPQDLFSHDLIGQDRADDILRGMAAMGFAIDREAFRLRTDNQIVAWEALKAGNGVGFAQASLIACEPGVEALLPDLPLPVLPMWIALHRDLRHAPRMRRVADFLFAELKAYAAGAPSADLVSPASATTTQSSAATPR